MRQKILGILAAVALLGSCSSEENPEAEQANQAPIIQQQTFEIIENAELGVSLGTLVASDPENDPIFFGVTGESSKAIRVNRTTGELTVAIPYELDYEASKSIVLEVVVNDALSQSRANVTINILNEEDGLLSNEQHRTITDYKTLVLAGSGFAGRVNKWQGTIKVFLDGNIADEFRELVVARNTKLNSLMTDGTKIELVDTVAESNVHIYLGPVSQIENLWPFFYEAAADGTVYGLAFLDEVDEESYSIQKGRVWLAEGDENLYFHEFGHILGFGHINRCDPEDINNNSFMCPVAVIGLDFTPFDEDLVRFTYHPSMAAGTEEPEIFGIIENILTGTTSGKNSFDIEKSGKEPRKLTFGAPQIIQ